MPRSPTGITSGRSSWNIRNICAVHSPSPFTAVSSAMIVASSSDSRRASSSSPESTCSASERRYAAFACESPSERRSRGSVAMICSGVGGAPP
jgi:hypothetical protein